MGQNISLLHQWHIKQNSNLRIIAKRPKACCRCWLFSQELTAALREIHWADQ